MNIGHYRLIAQVSSGRDGIRYRAEDTRDGVAVELFDVSAVFSDPSRRNKAIKRLRTILILDHPSSKKIGEILLGQSPPFFTRPWTDAPNLSEYRAARGPLSFEEAHRLGLSLLEAVSEGHRLGMVHGALGARTTRVESATQILIDWSDLDFGGSERAEGGLEKPISDDLKDVSDLLGYLFTGEEKRGESKLGDQHLVRLLSELKHVDPAERPSAKIAYNRLVVWKTTPSELESTGVYGTAADLASTDDLRATADLEQTGVMSGVTIPDESLACSTPMPSDDVSQRQSLGRFRLHEKLGQGGMGAVYRGEDMTDSTEVAIKVLNANYARRPDSLKRFLKEARLLAEVNSPHVTNLLEVNEDAGIHYIALEFVRGTNLSSWISGRGRLDENTALSIMADVCRALAVAHERRIVHRDVKPENILLLNSESEEGSIPRVKLADFGLARHVEQSDSLVMTHAGAILGTPLYMAPEQCGSESDVCPATDVYATGATLFHLLAGRPPFLGTSPFAVIQMHRNNPPPPLKDFNESVSDAVCEILSKALAKAPEARYLDAGELLLDLERLLRGEPTGIGVHPRLPRCEPKDLLQFDWRFDLESSPRRLWPHVTNTERLNRAVGIPAVEFSQKHDPEKGLERFGQFRKAGMTVAWQEFPFEWVEGRRMGVLREYSQGPFQWFVSIVELSPRADGGTTLFHRVRIAARGLLGRTLAAVEVGAKGKKAVEAVYRRIDAALTGRLGDSASVDPFEPASPLPTDRRKKLDAWLDKLGALGFDPTFLDKFGEFLAHAPAQEVARIRPYALARRLNIDRDQTLEACLRGASEGMLVLLWDILCPVCRIPSQVMDSLRSLKEHGNCDACHIDFDLDFANSVEVIFRVHPGFRETDVSTYCVGGPAHSPHVASQARVMPGERIVLDLNLNEGSYRFRGPQLAYSVDFRVEAGAPMTRWDVELSKRPGPTLPRVLRSGNQSLSFTNDTKQELIIRVERLAPREDAVTAAKVTAVSLFRELFPAEVLSSGRLLNLANVTLLMTDLENAAELYRESGDSRAFTLIHEHFQKIGELLKREGGALVKTVDEGVLASFGDAAAAVRAAIEIRHAMTSSESLRSLRLRVAVHRGPAMVATINDHLDYFGATARLVPRLLSIARGGDIILSRETAIEPGVASYLREESVSTDLVAASVEGVELGFVHRLPRSAVDRPEPAPERTERARKPSSILSGSGVS